MTWQPIETAPTKLDLVGMGEGVLLCGPVRCSVEGAWWRNIGWYTRSGWVIPGGEDQEGQDPVTEPTHWMPLPEPPK